jgi:hypothetical protein
MNDSLNAQPQTKRIAIDTFDKEFARLHARSCSLIEATPAEILYKDPPGTPRATTANSIGENVLRSAAAVEQTFGGITANLWDDPFEWTLPETLATPERMIEYLAEVEQTRQRAFAPFSNDGDLLKEVAVPSGKMKSLISLLLETMVRASEYQGRAIATLKMLSDVRPPGFII